MHIQEGFAIMLVLIGVASPAIAIGVVYYLKKRLEHKQIMAAVEKGVPFSELVAPKAIGPAWIRGVSLGIALLIIALGFLVSSGPGAVAAFVLAGVGAAWVVRGLLYRKYALANEPAGNRANIEHAASA